MVTGTLEGKFHINPETGNVNKCSAKWNCKFKIRDDKHYDTREEAQFAAEEFLAAETMDTDKVLKVLEKFASKMENDNRDFNALDFHLQRIKEATSTWTQDEKENLYQTDKMMTILNKRNPSEEDFTKAYKIIENLNSISMMTRISSYQDQYEKRDKNLIDFAKTLYWKKVSEQVKPSDTPAPERKVNDRITGLRDAQLENLRRYNDPGYDFMEGKKIVGEDPASDFDESLNRVIAGETLDIENPIYNDRFLTPKHDRLVREIQTDSPLYLATVFPDNELKEAMDRVQVSNVTATAFYNSREWGNAYTVLQPDGSTRTFAVYEHRNTDSIIINGKENWQGVEKELPYVADSKNAFFAEFAATDRKRAAEALAFYIKSAQNGELPSDKELAKNATKLDWNAIIAKDLPAFGEWLKATMPEAAEKLPKETDTGEDTLNRLDFD